MAAEAVQHNALPEDGGADFPDVRVDPRFVIKREGKDYVLMSGLVDLLHQVSEGFFEVSTTLVQVPGPDNDQTAICTARVIVYDGQATDAVKRVATGIGDASPASVTRMLVPHLIRMSETRAVARALRLLTNVGMTALEELGPSEERNQLSAPAERQAPAPPASAGSGPAAPLVEQIEVEGQRYTRREVELRWRQRREQAEALGVTLPPEVVALVPAETPLRELVGATQTLRRLCQQVQATQAGQR